MVPPQEFKDIDANKHEQIVTPAIQPVSTSVARNGVGVEVKPITAVLDASPPSDTVMDSRPRPRPRPRPRRPPRLQLPLQLTHILLAAPRLEAFHMARTFQLATSPVLLR